MLTDVNRLLEIDKARFLERFKVPCTSDVPEYRRTLLIEVTFRRRGVLKERGNQSQVSSNRM